MVWLLISFLAISFYDFRTRRIPNWFTIPLIIAGLILHLPGKADVWLASFFLLLAWKNDCLGTGDVKLWLGLLWALPVAVTSNVLFVLCATFFFSGLIQLIWRCVIKKSITGVLTPAAWRTIPFILLVWYVH